MFNAGSISECWEILKDGEERRGTAEHHTTLHDAEHHTTLHDAEHHVTLHDVSLPSYHWKWILCYSF
jgi:hypothetical protein